MNKNAGNVGITAKPIESYASTGPFYGVSPQIPAIAHQDAVLKLWNMKLTPMLCHPGIGGRFTGASKSCPVRSCVGMGELSADAVTSSYRNTDAIENIFCIESSIQIEFGDDLQNSVALNRFDMLSLPANVKHRVRNLCSKTAKFVLALNAGPESDFPAVFDARQVSLKAVSADALEALNVSADQDGGFQVDVEYVTSRITRFESLVPYKKGLNKSVGIPPEATEMLSAGSVYPLIVPEGHIGRSQTASMYGYPGLYISIAECIPGDDGPPPHAHSDTQENFFVLDGTWDIMTGFDNEHVFSAKPGDLFAAPPHIMRAFRNTGQEKARLLVIIQGPAKMDDNVAFSSALGEIIKERFGEETIEAYRKIKMTFDAEERFKAACT
jgi:mannose-6-phosphate isomerase-like protein (cupin superfamily)